jgi:Cdc6-like AAA superfamily ATPase
MEDQEQKQEQIITTLKARLFDLQEENAASRQALEVIAKKVAFSGSTLQELVIAVPEATEGEVVTEE